ncbi:MAG: hypothetical protein J5846_03365 [Desulfovibrio sp.]|nr:hypothetical protein [Desulfovibrio sp.]
MRGIGNVCFWLAFTAVGLVCEMLIPRIDALICGFILLLQERNYRTLCWLLPLFVLLQEGLGSRTFGGSIVWYAVIFLLFRIGERFFNSGTFIFVFFLSAAFGAASYGLNVLMAPLQDLEIDVQQLIDSSLAQAIFLPLSWCVIKYLRLCLPAVFQPDPAKVENLHKSNA